MTEAKDLSMVQDLVLSYGSFDDKNLTRED